MLASEVELAKLIDAVRYAAMKITGSQDDSEAIACEFESRLKLPPIRENLSDYQKARDFVSEWVWDAEKFGDTRRSETFNLDQMRDCALMIVSFIRHRAISNKASGS